MSLNIEKAVALLLIAMTSPVIAETEAERPKYKQEQTILDSSDFAKANEMAYLAFPTLIRINNHEILISYKRGRAHALDAGAVVEVIRFNTKTNEIVSRQIIGGEPEAIYQMGEWIAFPNGSIGNYVDVQRSVLDKGKKRHHRTGVRWAESKDRGKTFSSMKRLGKIDGVEYGYIFEGVVSNKRVFMLAMSFPELTEHKSAFDEDGKRIYGDVSVIASSDNGVSWVHVRNLSREFGGININESSLIVDGDGFIITTRGYDDKQRLHRVNKNFKLIREQNLTDKHTIIGRHIGRPRLFSRDGNLYMLGRNHTPEGPMELVLLRIDPESLSIERFVVLGPEEGKTLSDGYYAEPYFQKVGEEVMLNVVTYRRVNGKTNADLVRLEFLWDEVR